MRLKKILIILLFNSLILLISTIARAEETGYQFDWNLAPLKYEDDRFYIEKIIDLRPEDEKNVKPDPNRPVFLTTDIEVHLQSYFDKTLLQADYKTPLVFQTKLLNWRMFIISFYRYRKNHELILYI